MAQPLIASESAAAAAVRRYIDAALQSDSASLALPPLPAIALRAMALAEQDADLAALAQLVQKDLALAAQIVRIANSA
ncbi:MAG: HDOD domain-containing protein, partial [Steroidobacteraceae bacterium]|nr:HDOD domain-containing protein [Steroidobacteraceae bacterium]MDW8259094.1 HDOD domain-containing protein [Gammaproteobacteria bacterium]